MRSTSDGRPLSNIDSDPPPGEIIDGHTCPSCCNGVPVLPPLALPRGCRNTVPDGKAQTEPSEGDPVHSPSHYTRLQPEPKGILRLWGRFLSWYVLNAIKYLVRAGHKVGRGETRKEAALRDLYKSREYTDDEIAYWEAQP